MGEDLSIVLKAMLDQYSLKDIITQINDLSGKTVIKTDLLINDESLKKIDKSIDGLGERVKKLNKITLFKDDEGKSRKRIDEFADALGSIEKRIYTLNKEGNLEFSSSEEIENLKKQKEEYEKVIKLLERVDSAKNKVYENLDSQYGFIDIKGLEKVDNSLNNINLDTENLFTNYKQINSEVSKYEKQLKSLENGANKQRQTIDYAQTIQQVKELENAEKELAKWKEDFSKKNISEADYEILKQQTLSKIKSDAIRQQLEEQVRLNAELDKQNTLEREIALTKQNLQNKLSDITVKNDKYSVEELDRLKDSINNVSADTPKAKLKLRELSSEITQFGVEAKRSSSTTNSFSDSLKRFLTFYSLHDVIQTTKRVVRELVDTVYDLAGSLLEIQKVSDLTGQSLDSFMQRAYRTGDALSKTGKSVIDATTIFKRAGYDLNKSMDLAQSALIMQSVAENIQSVESASTSLISVLKGYGFETDKATHIIDAFNQVSNTQATNFDTLVDGASRISAVMKQQGNSFEEMIGLITGATEVLGTDSIERVSTQLRTLSLRLASMNEETGKFEPEIVSKLNDEFERLAGISLVDENKQIKTTYDIMRDMAKVMPTLDRNTRSYLMELASGKRGMETMEAILTNWENVEKATNSAVNSYGSSADEFQKYTESILGKTEKLKGAWEELAITTLNDDTIAWFLDATTAIIKLTTATGGLTPVVIGLVTAFGLLNAVKIKNTVTEIIVTFLGLTNGIKSTTLALNALSLSSKLFAGGAIVATVMAIGYGINYLSKESDRARESVETLSKELKDLQSNEDTVNELTNQYNVLKKLKEEQGLNNEEQRKFLEIQKQLHELLPDVNGSYDIQGNFLIDEKETLEDLNKVYKDYIKLKREELDRSARQSSQYTIKNYKKEKERLEDLIELANSPPQFQEETMGDRGSSFQNINIDEEIKDAKEKIKSYYEDLSNETASIIMNSDAWDELSDSSQDAINKIFADFDDTELLKFNEDLVKKIITPADLIGDWSNLPEFEKFKKEFEDSLDSIDDGVDQLTSSISYLEQSIKSLSSTRSDIESLTKILSNITDGGLTASDMEQLLSISEEFLPYLNDEIALREKLNEVINDSKSTYKATYEYMILLSSDTYRTLTNKIEKYFNDLGLAYKDDLKNYKDLETAKATISNNLIGQLAKKWGDYFSVGIGGQLIIDDSKGGVSTRVLEKQAREAQAYIDGFYKVVNDVEINPITIDFGDISGSAKSSVDKAISEIDRLRQEPDARLQDKEFEISVLAFSDSDVQKQITIYQQMQDELHKLAQTYRAMGLSENDDYIQQLRTQWMDYAENISQLQSVAFDNSNKSIDRAITQLELQQQLFKDNSQEYLDIEKKKYDEIVKRENLLQQEIARLQKIGTNQAKEQAESLIDTYYDTVSQRYNIIANLQSSQISIYNEQIKTLEKQKDALSNLHKYTMQMIKDELNAKKKSIQDELKGIEAVFNAKKKALRDEKDSRNYEKGLTEKSSLVADLENQLAIIKNDETAIVKRKKLEEELAKAKEDLADYQYEHSIDLQEKALDFELEKVKETYEDRIEELDSTLSNEVKMRESADKRIAKSGEKLYKELINYSKEYGSITEDEIKNAWDNADASLQGYKNTQEDVLNKLKEITTELSKIENLNTGDYSKSKNLETATYNQKLSEMKANSAKWNTSSQSERDRLAEENQKLGKELGLTYDNGIWYYDKQKKIRVYHSGGIVGGSGYGTKSTEELAKLMKGELVITPPQATKIMDSITNNSNSNITISMPIVIEGNADSDTVKQIEKQIGKIADTVIDKLATARANTGFKKKPKFI